MDYEKDVLIDESALDVEWLNQPSLAIKYGKYYAECYKRLQEAEEHIKLVRSTLIAKANDDPDYCLGKGVKPTAPNVEAFYRNHEDHIEAKKEIIEAQYELNIADTAKWQISNARKDALENLVKLHGQNYFAGPNIPRDISFEAEQFRKQHDVDGKVASRLNKKSSFKRNR